MDRTQPDGIWLVAEKDGAVPTWERAGIAVLMDIRRELCRLNAAISCPRFVNILRTLAAIKRNTTPRKKARKKAKR